MLSLKRLAFCCLLAGGVSPVLSLTRCAAAAEESYHAVVNSFEPLPHIDLDGMIRLQRGMVQVNPKVAGVRVEGVMKNFFMNKLENSGYIAKLRKK